MPDEFPTLEVVLFASVAVLCWRGVLLARARRELERDLSRLLPLIGDPVAARGLSASRFGTAIEPLARAALAASEALPARSVADKAERSVRALRSAAARDLVICAVLGGALVYAWATGLAVSPAFFVLGALAALLLLLAVRDRVTLGRAVARAATRLADALAERTSQPPAASARCRQCGHTLPPPLGPEEVGPRLLELGVRELFVCPQCGRVAGRAAPAASAPAKEAW